MHAAPRLAIPLTNAEVLVVVVRERENGRQSKTLNEFKNSSFFGSAIASSSAKESKKKKQKINKKYGNDRLILVQAFNRWREEFHATEVEIMLDSDRVFAVDYVVAKLLLKGPIWQAVRYSSNPDYSPKESLLV